jgi:hypothetical protein
MNDVTDISELRPEPRPSSIPDWVDLEKLGGDAETIARRKRLAARGLAIASVLAHWWVDVAPLCGRPFDGMRLEDTVREDIGDYLGFTDIDKVSFVLQDIENDLENLRAQKFDPERLEIFVADHEEFLGKGHNLLAGMLLTEDIATQAIEGLGGVVTWPNREPIDDD